MQFQTQFHPWDFCCMEQSLAQAAAGSCALLIASLLILELLEMGLV